MARNSGRKPSPTTSAASKGRGVTIARVQPDAAGNREQRRAAEKEAHRNGKK